MRVDSRPSPKRASTVLAGNKRAMSGRSYLAKISFRGWPSPGTLSAGKSYKLLLGIARQFAPGQLPQKTNIDFASWKRALSENTNEGKVSRRNFLEIGSAANSLPYSVDSRVYGRFTDQHPYQWSISTRNFVTVLLRRALSSLWPCAACC